MAWRFANLFIRPDVGDVDLASGGPTPLFQGSLPDTSIRPCQHSITILYEAAVAAGKIERDAAQGAVVDMLARLEARIAQHRLARKSSSLGWLFGARVSKDEPIKGLYLHGDVGRGKTMLMDLFFEASPVVRKRRAHFHEFMADVHERVHAFRQKIKVGRHRRRRSRSGSPLPRWRKRRGCSASMNSTSPTSPTP